MISSGEPCEAGGEKLPGFILHSLNDKNPSYRLARRIASSLLPLGPSSRVDSVQKGSVREFLWVRPSGPVGCSCRLAGCSFSPSWLRSASNTARLARGTPPTHGDPGRTSKGHCVCLEPQHPRRGTVSWPQRTALGRSEDCPAGHTPPARAVKRVVGRVGREGGRKVLVGLLEVVVRH